MAFPRSLRARLIALWVVLALGAGATGYVLVAFFRLSAAAQVDLAEQRLGRACREIADRYAFFASGWSGPGPEGLDDRLRRELTAVAAAALARAPGVEGGLWSRDAGPLAYAFPTYEGSGPKTDLPQAERGAIAEVNAAALRDDRAAAARVAGRAQTLVLQACPVSGPIASLTAWTMTRVFNASGEAYDRLVVGLSALALSVVVSALGLGATILGWSRRLARLERDLGAVGEAGERPVAATGEAELDRLVEALNASNARLGAARRAVAQSERLAMIGRLTAGVAHEVRNPIAAMRLRAENALASPDEARGRAALAAILKQVDRLDGLSRDLLTLGRPQAPAPQPLNIRDFLDEVAADQRELVERAGVALSVEAPSAVAAFDPALMRRAIDNLLANAVAHAGGGPVALRASLADGRLAFEVADEGPGVAADLRETLFEPFVTGRPEGVGLGLAIVREIARAHGGDARLADAPSGACVRIEIPWRT